MELHDLVALRNQLEPLTAKTAKVFADRELSKILYWVEKSQSYCTNASAVTEKLKNLTTEFNSVDDELDLLKLQLDSAIRVSEKQLYLDTYKYYVLSENRETPQEIEDNKRLKISDDDRNLFLSRINLYAKWQYPGLIIRPGIENFIDLLVSYQPLYIADHNQELLTMATKKFNDIFQQRLRQYVIRDFTNTPALDALPDQQFGLCFVYGYFNFRPIEFITDYLEQLYTKLKAGGVLIFTFNDCDWPEAVKLAQHHGSTYVPGRTLKNAVRSIGYQIEFEHTTQGASTWLELKKPGTLTSLKAAPTLAKIVELPK
jgi:SAM-dependent methyltransferase